MFETIFKKEEKNKPLSLSNSFFNAVSKTIHSEKLGGLLVVSGIITRQQLRNALDEQEKTGDQLGAVLVRQGYISQVQLYQKLAEQWCIRASVTGMALFMQLAQPSIAHAEEIETSSGGSQLTAQFTLAAATIPSAYAPHKKTSSYPDLFGSSEVKSNDISAFKKWTTVMRRFEDQMKTKSVSAPRIMMWKNEIEKLRGKSEREQIEGVNKFANAVKYIEDRNNFGKSDYWATPIEFFSKGGDCEDFAIAKYASLRALGFSSDQLRIAIVKDQVKNIAHAILIVYSNEGTFVLDNQNKRTEYMADVSRYKPIFSINSSSWWLHRA